MFQADLFKDKVVIVTGGGTGIGYAVAALFGRLGAHPVICSRKPENMEKGAEKLRAAGVAEFMAEVCNIRKLEEVQALVDRVIARYGPVDVLVNNAGGQFASPAEN